MSLDELRASMLDTTFEVLGIDVTITRPAPHDTPIETTGIWLEPLVEEQPYGSALKRREPRRLMAIARTEALSEALPLGTLVAAAELDGGDVVTFRFDGYERPVEPDLMRLILVPV